MPNLNLVFLCFQKLMSEQGIQVRCFFVFKHIHDVIQLYLVSLNIEEIKDNNIYKEQSMM